MADWDWGDAGGGAAAGAATGALVGSVVPGVGTAVGAIGGGLIGGVMGGLGSTDPEEVDPFRPPELTPAQQFEQQYAGKYDPTAAAGQVKSAESAMGIHGFDPNSYTARMEAALKARTDETLRAERGTIANSMSNSGFLNSGTARALDMESVGRAGRTFALGAGDIAQDSASKQLEENARRMGYVFDTSKANLANDQFSWSSELERARLNNDVTAQNNATKYGVGLDTYQLNELDPALRQDERTAGLISAGSSIAGAGIGAAGSIAGARQNG